MYKARHKSKLLTFEILQFHKIANDSSFRVHKSLATRMKYIRPAYHPARSEEVSQAGIRKRDVLNHLKENKKSKTD